MDMRDRMVKKAPETVVGTPSRTLPSAFAAPARPIETPVVSPTTPRLRRFAGAGGVLQALKSVDWRSFNHKHANFHSVGPLVVAIVALAGFGTAQAFQHDFYQLNSASQAVIGPVNAPLTKKITYDSKSKAFQYNEQLAASSNKPDSPQAALAAARKAGQAQKRGGGSNNYAVSLAAASAQGVHVQDTTDTTGQLGIKLVPLFKTRAGKLVQGRVVYPVKGRQAQLVYSVKANGLKEDLIIPTEQGDTASFAYKLMIPDALQARLLEDGSIGVFSADSNLYGNISFSTPEDQAKVEAARKHGVKNNLVFIIPAPVISQAGKAKTDPTADGPQADFSLENNVLTVTARHLQKAHYPLSIDPSIVVTSASDFTQGNLEGGIDVDVTNNQLKRTALTGATVSAWSTSSNAFTIARAGHSVVAANGYLYALGGTSGTAATITNYAYTGGQQTFTVPAGVTSIAVTAIGGSNASVGGKVTANLAVTPGSTIYIYVGGGNGNGYNGGAAYGGAGASDIRVGGTALTDRQIVAGGAGGDSNLPGGAGGNPNGGDGNQTNDGAGGTCDSGKGASQSAGGAGAMSFYGSYSSPSGTFGTGGAASPAGGGGGGYYGGGAGTTEDYSGTDGGGPCAGTGGGGSSYAGTGTSSVSYGNGTSTRANGTISITYGGSVGTDTSDTQYALLCTANNSGIGGCSGTPGTLGTWAATTSLPTSLTGETAVAYNGYIYVTGGSSSGTPQAAVRYALLCTANNSGIGGCSGTPGTLGTWNTTTSFTTARSEHTAVVYNGYLYIMGGINGTTYYNDVQYAPINANGTLGTWNTTTSFTTARSEHTAVVYNGYLYIMGGINGTTYYNDVQYAPINANGTLGTWNTTTSFTTARAGHTAVFYGGYVYILGGTNGSTIYNDVQYAPINANGTLGTWNTTTSIAARTSAASIAFNGYLYVIGGNNIAGSQADTQYGLIDPAGKVSNYTTATGTAFATARALHATVIYNGYIYIIGGQNQSGTILATVYYAPINSDGSVGNYTATTSLPAVRTAITGDAVAYNGYLYVAGGYISANTTDVTYAAIASNGTLGTWSTAGNLPVARVFTSLAVYNGYLYVGGGQDNFGTYLNTVLSAAINTNGTINSFSTAGTFATGRYQPGLIAYAGYMYVIGGNNGSDLTSVQYAQITSGGSLGTFSAGPSLTTARVGSSASVSNGLIYVTNSTSTGTDIVASSINSNGTLNTWTNAGTVPAARTGHASAAYNGFLYTTGGNIGGTFQNDTIYARINNGGSGATTPYTTGSSFSTARNGHSSVAYNGYLYVLGGLDNASAYHNDVQYAAISNTGTLGTFNATSSFISGRVYAAAAVYNGYLYIMGGNVSGTIKSDVQYAPINVNGTLGAWHYTHNSTDDNTTYVSGFTNARSTFDAVAYNGYLYITGGQLSGGTFVSDVQYATINANGTVGTWNTTASFTTGRASHSVIAYNNYLYIVGGQDASNSYNDVQYAPLNANGTVGSWAYTSRFHTNGNNNLLHVAIATNGYMYIVGSYENTQNTDINNVQYAPINTNGTVGNWAYTTSFGGGARGRYAVAAYNGFIYVSGGTTTVTNLADVQIGSQLAPQRKGSYSIKTQQTLSSTTTKLLIRGNTPDNISGKYNLAVSSSAAFSSSINIPSILTNGLTSFASTEGEVRFMNFTIDDTHSASFPETSTSNTGTLTDFEIFYHSGPGNRLRGGANFITQNLKGLDATPN